MEDHHTPDPVQIEYHLQTTTVWSFPDRGNWAGHRGDYRGNWSPHVPRNLILKYTREGDLVLDPMMGGATTLIESRLLRRRAIGVDINPTTVDLAKRNLGMRKEEIQTPDGMLEVKLGDARDLSNVADGSIDLVAAHPPYASIIQYSSGQIPQDLSSLGTLDGFFAAIRQVAKECLRVLKPGKHCAVLIGDTRKRGHYIPLAARLLGEFLGVGFLLRENVVKLQWNVTSEREKWTAPNYGFYKIAHEQLFVFRKPIDKLDVDLHAPSAFWTRPAEA